MFTREVASKFEDFYSNLVQRKGKYVYFYRVVDYEETVKKLISKWYEMAKKNGVVIEGGLSVPSPSNISYYISKMGNDFKLNIGFMESGLQKWLPEMNRIQRHDIAFSMLRVFQNMLMKGKNDNIIKNIYIKYLCWMYYKFEKILGKLGNNDIPKIIYEGNVTYYELVFLSILSCGGCDILLLQYNGDSKYLQIDPKSEFSIPLVIYGGKPFPDGFCLKKIENAESFEKTKTVLYGSMSIYTMCTNAWIEKQRGLDIIREPIEKRGKNEMLVYNAFVQINGAEDKYAYSDRLYKLQQDLKKYNRQFVIVNENIPNPTTEEIKKIRRNNFTNVRQLLINLSQNIVYGSNVELQKLMKKAFIDVILEENDKEGININKLTGKAVYLLCFLKRYLQSLFSNWKKNDVGVFIFLGGCTNDNEALFLRFLARIPVDVLILCPDLKRKCCLSDGLLYEENNDESVFIEEYPEKTGVVRIQTVASHAEKELEDIFTSDSNGIYKNHQFKNGNVKILSTTYEEILDIWNVSLNLRQFFRVDNLSVDIPVVYAKVSGVKNGNIDDYWDVIRKLRTDNTVLVKEFPYIQSGSYNKFISLASSFYKNNCLQKDVIKNHNSFPYAILREEMQNHILDKIEMILSNKLIKGIGECGVEYTVIGWCLNLPKPIVRLIQSFDFTKKNPKMIFINTTNKSLSLEDSIIVSLLNLVGFDILFFVPTGFRCVEKHFSREIIEEHQIGDYMYDLSVPDLMIPPVNKTGNSLFGKLLSRFKQ